jgi:hypothetical protein
MPDHFTRFDHFTPRTFSETCRLLHCSLHNSGQFAVSSSLSRLTYQTHSQLCRAASWDSKSFIYQLMHNTAALKEY